MGPSKNAALLEEERRGEQLAMFLKQYRPPLKEADMISLLEPKYGRFWSQEDEKKLDAKRVSHNGHITILKTDFTKSNTSAVMLWRVFPRLYLKLPTDLFCPANKIQFDSSATVGVDNIMWSKGFCEELAAFSINPFWTWDPKVDFPLMAQLMQLVVRCRTNDCREWRIHNYTADEFMEFVIEVLDEKADSGWTMKMVMEVALERYKIHHEGRYASLRPSEMRRLFQVTVEKAFEAKASRITGDYPEEGEIYKLTAKDLQLLNRVLAEFSPSLVRQGLEERTHGSTWKRILTHARGKKAQSDAVPHETEDISKVISLSLISRDRRIRIAKRKRQNNFTHRPGVSTRQSNGMVWGQGRPFASDEYPQDEDEEDSNEDEEDSDDEAVSAAARMKRTNTGKAKVGQLWGKVSSKRNRGVSVESGLESLDEIHDVNEDERALEESGYIPSDDIEVTDGKRRRLLPNTSNEETFNELGHSESERRETPNAENQASTASNGESSNSVNEVATRVDHGLVTVQDSTSSMCRQTDDLEEQRSTTNADSGPQTGEIQTLVDGVKSDLDAIQLQVGFLKTSQDETTTGPQSAAEEQQLLSKIKSKLEMMKTETQFLKENLVFEIGGGLDFDWQVAESKAARVGDAFTVGLDTKLVRWDPSLWQLTQSGLMSPSDVSNEINDMVSQMDLRTWNIQRQYLHWLARSHKVDCLELFKLVRDWELTMGKRGGDWVPGVPGVDLGRMVYVEALLEMYSEPNP